MRPPVLSGTVAVAAAAAARRSLHARPPRPGQIWWRGLGLGCSGVEITARRWRARSGLTGLPLLLRRLAQTTTTTMSTIIAAPSPPPPVQEPVPVPVLLPHRSRRPRHGASASSASPTPPPSPSSDLALPTNASTTLADLSARHAPATLARHLSAFLSLSKPRLTTLVVLSAMAPYALYPTPAFLSPVDPVVAASSLSPATLLFLAVGTALCSASANALNMLYEPATDALMSRTRARPLVRGLVSRRAACAFAAAAGLAGAAALYLGVNPTVAFLGAANIALYAGVYTPLKAVTALNTWVGAVVGAIPPLMGWAAAAGEAATRDGSWRELLLASGGGVSPVGGWLLAALLFGWQFPHFMALSWPIREEYRAAGLRMLAWTNPARNCRVALRYSLGLVPVCFGLCLAGVTEWTFAVTSLPVNGWLAWRAVGFWRLSGAGGSARGLFWASVWHLPAIMVLALLQKKGLWARIWRSAVGGHDTDDDDDDEWERVSEPVAAPAVTVTTSQS